MRLRDMDTVFMKGRGFDEGFPKAAIRELLQAVDFLHTEAQTVHTDIHPVGPLLLSHFGDARLGPGPHAGDIMPIVYRAPETLLYIQWSYAVDTWSVGLTVSDRLAAKVIQLDVGMGSITGQDSVYGTSPGPPPQELLNRHRARALEYWDEAGNWGDFVPIPPEKTLEAAETKLQHKAEFLGFMRRALTWDPAKRPTAKQLLQDPWLAE
ncbi:hypothetical protein VHEMI05541 [[Torrubiella] hemipterigena]|uniref:Protein kinase domain-containing protein n=1 Tax=[Torrubiella] hemipterigena TaxID=1531966 RepID=A0A0A1SYB0_9HYPO|nr:hypothetical protein VHEMI05541 [[Torrubiella] hemipterigena]